MKKRCKKEKRSSCGRKNRGESGGGEDCSRARKIFFLRVSWWGCWRRRRRNKGRLVTPRAGREMGHLARERKESVECLAENTKRKRGLANTGRVVEDKNRERQRIRGGVEGQGAFLCRGLAPGKFRPRLQDGEKTEHLEREREKSKGTE